VPDTPSPTSARARGVDAERALADAGSCLERMRAVLRDAGVDDLSMRTTQSSTWTDSSATGSSRVVARLGLQVTLRDVAVAGTSWAAAVSAGGEPARMDGIRLEISDPTEPRARAPEAAWADAVARATQWATLAGRTARARSSGCRRAVPTCHRCGWAARWVWRRPCPSPSRPVSRPCPPRSPCGGRGQTVQTTATGWVPTRSLG
jgi:hypothetical protein